MSSNLKVNTILPSTGTAIGIGTDSGNVDILGHIVGHNTPNISGINSVTASHFYGDGSQLSGIDASSIKFGGSTKAQANAAGVVVTGILTATSFKGDGSGLTGLSTPLSFRNLIINGAMQVAQRSTSAVNVPGGKTVTDVDRFGQWTKVSEGGWKTGQQVADAPAGFQYSRKITSSAANTVASGSYHTVRYAVEGFDAAQLNCGNSSAKTVTLSFYVKSSITGNFGLNFTNSANNRSYPVVYTITGNDWEQKTITLTLDTSGTWLTDSGVGLEINWKLALGSNYDSSDLNQWQAHWRFPENTVNLLATNGATFQLTGVQLEVGSQASTFEHRSIGEELLRCQRYFISGKAAIGQAYNGWGGAQVQGVYVTYPVIMRANPSLTFPTNHSSSNVVNTDYSQFESSTGFSYRVNLSGNGNYHRQSTYNASSEI